MLELYRFGRGGVPLKKGGETVGAIGVSGATSEQDETYRPCSRGRVRKMNALRVSLALNGTIPVVLDLR